MCGENFGNETGADEFLLDTKTVRDFIAHVREEISHSSGPEGAIENIKSAFSRLLEDDGWLPEKYRSPAPESGMGGGIGQWLIFRSGLRDLSLFALVVPSGSETPVHDHLAWGLIGLYEGEQKETVFAREDEEAPVVEREKLSVAFTRSVERGDFYPLLPPTDDVHKVETTSGEPSVSIHLLANDTGCVWRHAFDPETSEVRPFRSGYVNRECGEEEAF
jgi:predicted metal-dependent enzyme (double-stranded beta helix superfamily)